MTSVSDRIVRQVDDTRHPLVRLASLLDGGSFDQLPGQNLEGVHAVRGRIDGAAIVAFCTDATSMGGALGLAGSNRIVQAINTALVDQVPVVGIWHSGGARLADGVESMHGVGQIFAAITRASGQIPQISVIVGPAAGAAAYGPALTDFMVMAPAGRVFITGPDVVCRVTGERIDMEGLGGAEAHGRRSGVVHVTVDSEPSAYRTARQLVGVFTRPGVFTASAAPDGRDPSTPLPSSTRRAYDVHPILRSVLDKGADNFLPLQPRFAPNMVTGFGRLTGRAVGVVANNPLRKGGCLDALSAEKAARFVRVCDAFGVPLLVVADVPGYLPGIGEEWGGVVRRGAKLLHAFAEAVVPRVTLVTRKSYGGAYIAMNSRSLGATRVLAWPDAEVAVMGAEAAVEVLYRKQLAAAAPHEVGALKESFVAAQTLAAGGVGRALELGVIDEIVEPADTRGRLVAAFESATPRRGRHNNIPL